MNRKYGFPYSDISEGKFIMKKMYLAIFLIILVAVVFAGCLSFSGTLSTSTTEPEEEQTFQQTDVTAPAVSENTTAAAIPGTPENTTAAVIPGNTVPGTAENTTTVVVPGNTVPGAPENTTTVVVPGTPENTTSSVFNPETATNAPGVTQPQGQVPVTPETTAPAQPGEAVPPSSEVVIPNSAPASSEYDILKSGTFHMSGSMADKTGTSTPMEVAITPDSIYMLSDFSGVPMGMLIKDNKVYMIYPDKRSYLELSDSLMNMAGLDVAELTNSDSVNFGSYGKLEEADSVTQVVYNGRTCQVYHFKVDSGESRVYMDGTKLVRLASYDTNGKFITSTDITAITSTVPAEKSAPPTSYKAYKGMTGMFSFMTLLEGVME